MFFSKYQNGDGTTKIFRNLSDDLSLKTVKKWRRMIDDYGAIELSYSPTRPHLPRTPEAIQRVKKRMNRKKRMSGQILSHELGISETTIRRILKDDLGYHP